MKLGPYLNSVAVAMLISVPSVRAEPSAQDALAVPQAIVTYAYLTRTHSPEFGNSLNAKETIFPELRELQEGLSQANPDIATSMAFVQEQVTLPWNAKGFDSKSETTTDTHIGRLLVTPPVPRLSNAVVVFLSVPSPERVFVFAVDPKFRVTVYYDSESAQPRSSGAVLRALDSVRLRGPCDFELAGRDGRVSGVKLSFACREGRLALNP